jgi:DNA-binding LacI/PurR family transcriptional regulator
MACAKLLTRFAPTAVVAVSDVAAIGAMHCAFDRGLKVPGDLSIVGFDDIFFAEFAHPALTTVNIPRSEVGTLAYRALTKMQSAVDRCGEEYRVATSLVVRESTAPLPTGTKEADTLKTVSDPSGLRRSM